jgi:alkylhydroperoxidase family enzyme
VSVRILPIDKPKNIFVRIGFSLMKKQFGKVIMPARVVYARYPKLMFLTKKLMDIEQSMHEITDELKFLIQNFVATINGCSFCMDIAMKRAIQKKMPLEKFNELPNFKISSHFSDKEKAALTYVQEMTNNVHVPDEIFTELKKHWNDDTIIEITFTAAAENYLNLMTKPLGIGSDGLCMIK